MKFRRRFALYTGGMPSERQISVGSVPIGGGAPVAVQTMTKTETADLQATMAQIERVAEEAARLAKTATTAVARPKTTSKRRPTWLIDGASIIG